MKKRRSFARKHTSRRVDHMLPIDTRILPDIFSFGHVKGMARVFLQVEIILSVLVVVGTVLVVLLKLLR